MPVFKRIVAALEFSGFKTQCFTHFANAAVQRNRTLKAVQAVGSKIVCVRKPAFKFVNQVAHLLFEDAPIAVTAFVFTDRVGRGKPSF